MTKQSYKLTINDEEILFDYTNTEFDVKELYEKNKILEPEVIKKLKGLFNGELTNYTEQRKVLHWMLRLPSVLNKLCKEFDYKDIKTLKTKHEKEFEEEKEIVREYKKMGKFVKDFRDGKLKGFSGKKLDTVVNIGIGGSDLGPKMVCDAFKFMSNIKTYFISNVDPANAVEVLNKIDPETTLFIVLSKTFTTRETMENARLVKKFILELHPKAEIEKNFVAVSANVETAKDFGVREVFAMFDYIGGRFSVWSTAGLIIALKIGFRNFLKFLNGASIMDNHVKENLLSLDKCIPYIQSILEMKYMKLGYTKNIVGYSISLELFYKFLQQLEMESNGKKQSGMVIWGGVGTDVQHSYFQMIHQGDKKVLTEFIVPMKMPKDFLNEKFFKKNICESKLIKEKLIKNHETLVANCIAQSRSLFEGEKNEDVNKHFPGKRPSFYIAMSNFVPELLGSLMSMHENKVIIQGFLLNINSFDQYGVALGKTVAGHVEKGMSKANEYKDEIVKGFGDFYTQYKSKKEEDSKKE